MRRSDRPVRPTDEEAVVVLARSSQESIVVDLTGPLTGADRPV
jgi:hypothetical protein